MKKLFLGVATAIVTPFNIKGEIDYNALKNLIEFNLQNKVKAIVVCGTTGEASTLSYQERTSVIKFSANCIGDRVPLIAGVGSNNYDSTIKMIKSAEEYANGFLIVSPYYNKTTQFGLETIYKKYASATNKPIIAYNVPSRTGLNISPSTYKKLQGKIYGVKEANSDISQLASSISCCKKLVFYTGNDDLILPSLSLGASGVISVISNILPSQTANMVDNFFNNKVELATKQQLKLLPIIKSMFCEVNPIPVKYALYKMGLIKNVLRLPLVPLSKQNREQVDIMLKNYNLI